jgi:transketolase C-terminal domain/subunit
VIRVGLPDTFAETGPYAEILDRYGMSVEHIVTAARRAVALKSRVPA